MKQICGFSKTVYQHKWTVILLCCNVNRNYNQLKFHQLNIKSSNVAFSTLELKDSRFVSQISYHPLLGINIIN